MNIILLLSTVLALSLYIPLCTQIITGKAKQNFATWGLWATLDGIVAGTLIVQYGNYFLATTYTIGSTVASICILKSGTFRWSWFESFVTALVVICIIIWATSGSKVATVASTMAMVIAGIPQLVETARKPQETPVLIYLGYTAANFLSALGAKDWSIQERFYPTCAAIYCFTIAILAMRKSKNAYLTT